MPLYEHVYLARQDVSAQQVEDLTKQFTSVIEGLGGKVTKNEYWGVKSLNFRIKKNRKAHFTLLNVDAPAAALAEVERQQRINEDVIRYLTVRVDELEEGPSAMMRKADRDRERDDRGGREGGFRGDGFRGDREGRGDHERQAERQDLRVIGKLVDHLQPQIEIVQRGDAANPLADVLLPGRRQQQLVEIALRVEVIEGVDVAHAVLRG